MADPANLAFDLTAALERVDGEREFLAELTGIYLDEIPKLLASLQQAVEQSNNDAVSEVAHTIKGTVANFCAQSAFAAAFKLEQITRKGATENVSAIHQTLIREVDRLTQDLKREFGLHDANS